MASAPETPNIYSKLEENPCHFLEMSGEALFDLDWPEVEALQLRILQRRYEELRPKVRALDRLSDDLGINEVTSFDDLSPLSFPHTMYKSYTASDADKGRYDKLTRWLQSLSAYDLSDVDLSGCTSLEGWLERLSDATPLRPVTSSGTSGKISVLPRGVPEEIAQVEMTLRAFEPYRDQPGFDIRKEDVSLLFPLPSGLGRQSFANIPHLLRTYVYQDKPEMVHVLGKGWIDADELRLTSRLLRAEASGERLELNEFEQKIAATIAERNRNLPDWTEEFLENAVIGNRGRKVLIYSAWTQIYQIARICSERGIKIEWAPESLIFTGGGSKGFVFPDGWREVIDQALPYTIRQVYGMSESTSVSIECVNGHLHPLPWGIQHIVDPATGASLPRKGRQTGRLLVHDLLATSFWPATLSGDLVTLDWDGNCGCGRKGPYFLNTVERLSDVNGGDDKVSCAKSPQAYERLEQYILTGAM